MGKLPKPRKLRPLANVTSHILTAIDRVERFTSGHTLDSFVADERPRLAVERCLEIISEASRDVPQSIKDEHPDIDWRRMADAGNVYRHVYDAVDPDIVWSVAREHLPPLKTAIGSIRERHCNP